ncbi:TPA: hypothetical protein HA239_02135 [Candidatus Woesearchaeota archaeon]|nr:hypothetical protein QT06_C0001G1031 [archaeon GW2011_AR15]MBS3104497.1 hypothetical protein [Candidatus Woesearchaeota archaeon]HIH41189.1 hypothetical protein [Candidatus Woesearchaeota archaeon]
MKLKERVFSGKQSKFSLDEILESLAKQTEEKKAFVFIPENRNISIKELEEQVLLVDLPDPKHNILLYEVSRDFYYVYTKQDKREPVWTEYAISEKQEEKDYGLFAPSGVIVRRVSQNTLGNGVLGRAFIHSNYIEILDSLMGSEYQEVLTHEVLHILHPEKGEMDIRQMTRYQLGSRTTYH